ncbi:MAG: sugar ABC transporter substrate-binding protein [Limnochordales bacterium]|nr:sugar ABC transporter substrate-binding protein [Limnochordales bacterium]
MTMLATAILIVVATPLALPAALARTQLILATYGEGQDINKWNEVVKAFTARYPQYEVKVQVSTFNEYPTKIVTQIATGNAPDVIMTWAQYKPKWVEQGLLLDVTDRWAASETLKTAGFYPAAVDAARYNGRMYGVPFDYNAMVWYVNTTILEEAGLAVPDDDWTVEDMRAISRKALNPDKGISGPGIPIDWGWGPNIQWYWNWTGHEWLDETRTRVLVNDSKSLEMFNWWLRARADLTLPPGKAKGDFFGGYQSMWEGWFTYTRLIWDAFRQAKGSKPYDFVLKPYPKAPSGVQRSFAQGHMWSIPVASAKHDDAWKLAEWLAGPEGQAVITRLKIAAPGVLNEDLWQSYLDYLPAAKQREIVAFIHLKLYGGKGYARNFNYWTTFDVMNEVMIKHLRAIFQQGKAPENELAQAKEELANIIKQQTR